MESWIRKYGLYALLILYSGYTSYVILRMSASITTARLQQVIDKSQTETLRDLLVATCSRWKRSDLTKLVEQRFASSPNRHDHLVEVKPHQLAVDELIIHFQGDSVSAVTLIEMKPSGT